MCFSKSNTVNFNKYFLIFKMWLAREMAQLLYVCVSLSVCLTDCWRGTFPFSCLPSLCYSIVPQSERLSWGKLPLPRLERNSEWPPRKGGFFREKRTEASGGQSMFQTTKRPVHWSQGAWGKGPEKRPAKALMQAPCSVLKVWQGRSGRCIRYSCNSNKRGRKALNSAPT